MVIIIARLLYGLNISGAACREKLAETLMSLVYKSSKADADVWMKRDVKPNGDLYYKYMIWYVDDLLNIGFKTKEETDELNMIYLLKEGLGPPDRYLGANVEKVQFKDVRVVWSTNCVNYLKRAIDNVDTSLGADKTALNNYGDGHRQYSSIFRPELDVTEELEEEMINRYQQIIGVLRLSIELGRIDILT